LLQSGGFGLVALNLADVAAKYTRRIITSWWFRFRRAIENTPTTLVVLTPVACIRSCAALVLELKSEGPVWPNTASFVLENSDVKLTMKDSREHSTPRLSLVTDSILPLEAAYKSLTSSPYPLKEGEGVPSLPLTHSNLLQGIRVRINQERPVSWTTSPARFTTRLH
jgi:hypothetical protein